MKTFTINQRRGSLRSAYRVWLSALIAGAVCTNVSAQDRPREIRSVIVPDIAIEKPVALTLDACSGQFDAALIDFLILQRIPATIFATKKWLTQNPRGLAILKANLDLFDIEDHGEKHIPAIIGAHRKVYGIPGEPDILHLQREVVEGAKAVEAATGVPPHWYRGAAGEYDQQAADEIRRLGYKIAGFSVNADDGATLKKKAIIRRMQRVRSGDVVIAHVNKPESETAEGLQPAILELLFSGFVFVRLDQVELKALP